MKTTPKVQVPLGATDVPLQVSLTVLKSPEGTTLVTLRETLLGLVSVIVFVALGTSTCWVPKLRLAGENVGDAMMPLPERFTFCGLFEAVSTIISVPVRVPVWLGVNTTPMTQFALGASVVPLHPSLERLKSPEGVTVLTFIEELFGLVTVTFFAAEVVPTACCGNASASGLTVSFVAAVAVAVGVAVLVPVAVGVAVLVAVTVAVAVRVAVAVEVEVGVAVGVAVLVAVAVAVSVAVAVAVDVAVAVAVAVDVAVAVLVAVAVAVSVAVGVAVAVAVSVAVGVAVAVAVAVAEIVATAVGVAVAVAVSVAVGVGVGGNRNWAARISPFWSISAEFLPDGEGSPTFKSSAASSAPRSPQPLAPGTAKVLSATTTPVEMSAFPPGPPEVSCGVLVGVSTRFKTIGLAFDPI